MNPDFASELAEAMATDKVIQDNLAAASGVAQSTVSRHLRGLSIPRLDQVAAYERALPSLAGIRERNRSEALRRAAS